MDELKRTFWKNKRLSKTEESVALEQYKLYVEMADRISERRDKANAFFLTLNSLAIGAIGFLWDKHLPLDPKWIILFPFFISLGFCWFWYRLVTSYRQLNTVKFDLIGDVEDQLPIRLWKTEWKILDKGEDPQKYKPLSHIEQNLPIAFAILYVVATAIYLGF